MIALANPGAAMAIFVYLTVAVVTVFGVLLEMNVLVEPARKIEYAALPANPSVSTPESPAPAEAPPQADAGAPAAEVVSRAPVAAKTATGAVSSRCDVTACAAAYHTFRASDCTYQASGGERRLCTKGVVSDPAAAAAVLGASADAGESEVAQCHVDACAHAYISFNAADCTYQPSQGPRRLCTK